MHSPLHGHLRLALAPQLPQREPAFRCGKREQGAGQPPRDAGTGDPAGRAEVREAWRHPPRLLAPPPAPRVAEGELRRTRRCWPSARRRRRRPRRARSGRRARARRRAGRRGTRAAWRLDSTRATSPRRAFCDVLRLLWHRPRRRRDRGSVTAGGAGGTAEGGGRRVASRVLRGWRRDAERRTGSPPSMNPTTGREPNLAASRKASPVSLFSQGLHQKLSQREGGRGTAVRESVRASQRGGSPFIPAYVGRGRRRSAPTLLASSKRPSPDRKLSDLPADESG